MFYEVFFAVLRIFLESDPVLTSKPSPKQGAGLGRSPCTPSNPETTCPAPQDGLIRRGFVQTHLFQKLPCLASLALLSCVFLPPLHAQESAPTQTTPASTCIRSFGVNVHMEYTDGHYADAPKVLLDLGYLGIPRVRDALPRPEKWLPHGQAMDALNLLASAGIHFDFTASGDSSIPDDMQQLDAFARQHPSAIVSVEGPNEINNWPVHHAGITSEQAATAFQHALYTAVHADPLLANVPVLYYTGGVLIDLKTHTGLADAANTHPYPHSGEQPFKWLRGDYDKQFTMGTPQSPGFPWQITETGYYTLPSSHDWGGVDDATQAKMLLNLMFDATLQGVDATYLYQLLDPYPYTDPRGSGVDGHLGLFSYNGEPKPSATAIRNLFSFLSTAGTVTTPQAVRYSVTGLPPTGHSLALTRNDGTLVIALWNEPPAWDAQTGKPLHPKPVSVQVADQKTVPAQPGATLEDPISGKQTSLTPNATGYTVQVPDSPVLLVLPPQK
jgi:hypothetical protein